MGEKKFDFLRVAGHFRLAMVGPAKSGFAAPYIAECMRDRKQVRYVERNPAVGICIRVCRLLCGGRKTGHVNREALETAAGFLKRHQRTSRSTDDPVPACLLGFVEALVC